jgi:phage I-like protein
VGPNTSPVQRACARATELPGDLAKGPPKEFRIFPRGTFTTRNHDRPFLFDEESARLVMEAARVWGNQFHVDYEHAALDPGERGSPAAAWFDLEVRDDGLWAINVQWTEHATKALASREYRYFSPVWNFDEKTGRVLQLLNIALTNLPATDHMVPLAASQRHQQNQEQAPMKTLLAALKLSESATEAEALAALSRVQELQTAVSSLTGKATPAEVVGTLQAFKASHEALAQARQELEALRAEKEKVELEKVIEEGLKAGKLTQAMLEWARKQGVAELRAYLAVAHRVIPTPAKPPKGEGKGGENQEEAALEVTEADRHMAHLTGTDLKLIAASRKRHGGRVPRGEWLQDRASHESTAAQE